MNAIVVVTGLLAFVSNGGDLEKESVGESGDV